MNIVNFRITANLLLPRIQEASKNSSNIIFIPPLQKRSMTGMMTYQQARSCLMKGKIIGKPKKNVNGDWEVEMERFAANQLFTLKVIVKISGVHVEKLYVLLKEQENV